jgi:uncharacterized protein (TIGR02246 family)
MTTEFLDAVEQEVWDTIRSLNQAWTSGDTAELARYFHPDMVAITASAIKRRKGGQANAAGWRGFADSATIHHWKEIDPVIHIYGDAAVVAYSFDLSFRTDGRRFRLGGRDVFFLARENGRWRIVADQSTSYPA